MDSPTYDDYMTVIRLFEFYNVKTEGQLVLAMDKHISKLQEKLNEAKPLKDDFPRTPREG